MNFADAHMGSNSSFPMNLLCDKRASDLTFQHLPAASFKKGLSVPAINAMLMIK